MINREICSVDTRAYWENKYIPIKNTKRIAEFITIDKVSDEITAKELLAESCALPLRICGQHCDPLPVFRDVYDCGKDQCGNVCC